LKVRAYTIKPFWHCIYTITGTLIIILKIYANIGVNCAAEIFIGSRHILGLGVIIGGNYYQYWHSLVQNGRPHAIIGENAPIRCIHFVFCLIVYCFKFFVGEKTCWCN
jgi:hypothetical protein